MIQFDTNFLIAATVSGSPAHQQVLRWAGSGASFGISTVAWAEYLCGPLDPTDEMLARQLFAQPEPFHAADAELAAHLFNQTGRRSRSLADCMIAAVAIRTGADVATVNVADFTLFLPFGLKLANSTFS